MTIQALTPTELAAYIASEAYRNSHVVPISLHRAQSHINNPRVEASDQIMFLAMEGKQLVGYLGVLADRIYVNEQPEKGGWLSCMWVDPNQRGKGIAKKLLADVFESWGNRILVTEFTVAAKGLYDRSEMFEDLSKPHGLRGYLRFQLHEILPRKYPKLTAIKGLIKAGDAFLNIWNDLRLTFWNPKSSLTWEYIREIDEETNAFIQARQTDQLTRRTATDLNWMLQNPWVLSSPLSDSIADRYHFSAVDTRFDFIGMKLYNADNQLVGLIILSIRGNSMKIPYCYVEPDYLSETATLIYQHLLKEKLNMLSVFHPELVKAIQAKRNPFFHLRTLKRHYIISKVFGMKEPQKEKIRIQDGDADCAFT